MEDYRAIAKQYIEAGYSVIPVNETKNPAIPMWGKYQVRSMSLEEVEKYFKKCWGIALVCGGPWKVVALDFDLKYDLTGTLFDRYKKDIPKELLKKMFVQTTMNGGYHFAFTAPSTRLRGNEKLASRRTTAYERDKTYREAFDDPAERDMATKIAYNDKSKVLIETRSGTDAVGGGYIVISPTPGYKKVWGKIQSISEEEYDVLDTVARKYNEVKELQVNNRSYDNTEWELDPIDHYNKEGDVVQILLDNGWKIVEGGSSKVERFKRPGQTHSASSALFNKDSRILTCYSTSCEFETTKGYSPFGVYAMLEQDNDFTRAYRVIVGMGYGVPKK